MAALKPRPMATGPRCPDGYWTTLQHAEAAGLSIQQANKIIKAGVLAGKVERKTFRIRNGARVVPIPHYRVIL